MVETQDKNQSLQVFQKVYQEVKRLEKKYSRYEKGNIIDQVNTANGKKIKIDEETFRLLKFADTLFHASHGMFDITSGVLRRAWIFDQSNNIPPNEQILPLLNLIGWQKVEFNKNFVRLPDGWQLDFGGIGKEYAADRGAQLAHELNLAPTLVNLGGDIAITGPKRNGSGWKIELDEEQDALILLSGGVATSGDKNKYLLQNGKKLSHILNAKTAYPVEDAPRSTTVVASTCTEAGALSTLSMLYGKDAEKFLKEEAQDFRVFR
ncbi:MAG: FAD:protein FMN transferase [Bdellovibrionaceae bacterium]|nr:FAD:protein FMN transferase [Pseudobdellovibrionaceae bacterium]